MNPLSTDGLRGGYRRGYQLPFSLAVPRRRTPKDGVRGTSVARRSIESDQLRDGALEKAVLRVRMTARPPNSLLRTGSISVVRRMSRVLKALCPNFRRPKAERSVESARPRPFPRIFSRRQNVSPLLGGSPKIAYHWGAKGAALSRR